MSAFKVIILLFLFIYQQNCPECKDLNSMLKWESYINAKNFDEYINLFNDETKLILQELNQGSEKDFLHFNIVKNISIEEIYKTNIEAIKEDEMLVAYSNCKEFLLNNKIKIYMVKTEETSYENYKNSFQYIIIVDQNHKILLISNIPYNEITILKRSKNIKFFSKVLYYLIYNVNAG